MPSLLVATTPPSGYDKPPGTYDNPPETYKPTPDTYDKPPTSYDKPPETYKPTPDTYDKPPETYKPKPDTYDKPPDTYKPNLTPTTSSRRPISSLATTDALQAKVLSTNLMTITEKILSRRLVMTFATVSISLVDALECCLNSMRKYGCL
ncbi:hypothetical protein BC826DRAFT_435881 [Russula brevipes]|nr:hypothetical protein BC826DRAFT_435881 [Russula brevipes]